MISYPDELNVIFDKLALHKIRPIIVGGFVRDSLLGLKSKDIDIELYGISSLEKLENILKEFGNVNSVGKSFGVCKLEFNELDLDFSLPRTEKKNALGHKGFSVETKSDLDYKIAASRRDFTVNSMGYDIVQKKILDPYDGLGDLNSKVLRQVNEDSFIEDPLRVLRAVQFSTRFHFTLSRELFTLCKQMIKNFALEELPKERIFDEIKKLLLKSSPISPGIRLLKEIGAFEYFREFNSLSKYEYEEMLTLLDKSLNYRSKDEKSNLIMALSTICFKFQDKERDSFLLRLSNEKELIHKILTLLSVKLNKHPSNYELFSLAQKVELSELIKLSEILNKDDVEIYLKIRNRAKVLNILTKSLPPLIQGRDLIKLGLKASPEFSKILSEVYEAQKKELFATHKDGIIWLQKELLS